jgi:Na+-driven multidrug efflux pump
MDFGVAGAGYATLVAQAISSILVVYVLMNEKGAKQLVIKKIGFDIAILKKIIMIGLPTGVQASIVSLSNVVVQSYINAFGSSVIAGYSASIRIDGFVNLPLQSFGMAITTFVGQNMGAKQYRRIPRIMLCSGILCVAICALSSIILLFPEQCIGIYSNDPAVIRMGVTRLFCIVSLYIIVGFMNTFSNSLRAMGHSFLPMLTCVAGVCGLRIIWIYGVFPFFKTLLCIYISYPISWFVTLVTLIGIFLVKYRQLCKTQTAE